MAEKDFARFRIDAAELASRRSWNAATRAQVDALKGVLSTAAAERKQAKAQASRGCAHRRAPRPWLTPCSQQRAAARERRDGAEQRAGG